MLGKNKNSAYADDGREKVSTLIGKETTFDGDLTSAETVRIDGVINGNCSCENGRCTMSSTTASESMFTDSEAQ